LGDWVETINDPALGSLTPNMALRMREFIARYGRDAAGTSRGLGKAVVVHVMLWDCAETSMNGQWSLIQVGSTPASCADLPVGDDQGDYQGNNQGNRLPPVDRVHVFSIVPFTFYENLIAADGSSVQAYWGDAFGQPGFYRSGTTDASCATDPSQPACQLNPLMNSAFLVPDPGE